MAGNDAPWLDYQAAPQPAPDGPWMDYQSPQSQGWGEYATGLAKAAGTGLERGAIALGGTIGNLQSAADTGAGWALKKLGMDPNTVDQGINASRAIGGRAPTSEQITGAAQSVGVPFHQPQTNAERYTESATSFVPAMLAGPGSIPVKVAAGLAGGLGSEAAGQATQGTVAEPYARMVGGLAAGGAGLAAPSIWRGVANVLAGRGADVKSINTIIKQLDASGMTPQQAEQRLRELGPEGMLGDVSPGMQTVTGAAGISDSGAGNTIAQRLASRREGGQARMSHDLDQAFGPPADRFIVEQANKAEKDLLKPVYEAARGRGVVVSPIISHIKQIEQRFPQTGAASDSLRSVRSMLYDRNTGKPLNRAGNLIGVRQEMDHLVKQAGSGSYASGLKTPVGAALSPLRETVNKVLHQNKALRDADMAYHAASKQMEAYTMGRKELLRGGPETMTPAQVQVWKSQNRGSVGAAAQGVRTEMDRVLSNERLNPGIATDRMLSRDKNMEKVGALIGQKRVPGIERAIDREATFRDTSSLGEPGRGSRTAPLMDTARRVFGADNKGTFLGDTLAAGTAGGVLGGPAGAGAGVAAVTARRISQKIADALGRKVSEKAIRATADKLTATGASRDDAMLAINTAFQRLKSNPTVTKIERLAQALLLGTASQAPRPEPQR